MTCNHFESFSHVSDWHSIANSICNPAESLTKNQTFWYFSLMPKDLICILYTYGTCEHDYLKKLIQCKEKNLGQNILAFGFFMAKIGISSTIKQSSQEKFSPQFEFSIYILSKCKNVKVVKLLLLHFNFLFWDEEDFFLAKGKISGRQIFTLLIPDILYQFSLKPQMCGFTLKKKCVLQNIKLHSFDPKIPICVLKQFPGICARTLFPGFN